MDGNQVSPALKTQVHLLKDEIKQNFDRQILNREETKVTQNMFLRKKYSSAANLEIINSS